MSDYTPQVWHDLPSTDTPIDAERLGHIETGIAEHVHPSGDVSLGDLTTAIAGEAALRVSGDASAVASAAADATAKANAAQAASQPVDSDLTAIAALSTTSFGRSFLDRADAAAGRTLLGLGTAATTDSTAYAPLAKSPTNTTQFWRADGSWASPSGGSGVPTVINAKDSTYGALGDLTGHSDGAMTSGSAVLTSAAGVFTSADVGKVIWVAAAAAAGATLVTTIASYQSATQVTLTSANASGGNVTAKVYAYGTDDTTAIQAAINAAATAGGGCVYLPAGTYLISAALQIKNKVDLRGAGRGATTIKLKANTAAHMFAMSAITDDLWWGSDITFDGNRDYQAGAANSAVNLVRTGVDITNVVYASPAAGHRVGGGRFGFGNVDIVNVNGDGYSGDAGVSELRLDNMLIFNCNGHGVNHQGGDSFFNEVTVGSVQKSGFYTAGSGENNRFVNCKAYGCDQLGAGWAAYWMYRKNTLVACDAQETPSGGFILQGEEIVLDACRADGCGGVAVVFNTTANNCTVDVTVTTFSSYTSTYLVGFDTTVPLPTGNICHIRQGASAYLTGWVANDPVGNSVWIDNNGPDRLLARVDYLPGSQATPNTASTTLTDVDATNLAVTFVAPVSGRVRFVLAANCQNSTGGGGTCFGLRTGSTVIASSKSSAVRNAAGVTFTQARATVQTLVASLTPGTSYTYKFAFCTIGGGTSYVLAGPDDGAAMIEVWAA